MDMNQGDTGPRQIPGGSWEEGQWYSDTTLDSPAKNVTKGKKKFHLAYITEEEARILEKQGKKAAFIDASAAPRGAKGEKYPGAAPKEWVSEPSHAKSRLVYITDEGASHLKKLDIHGSGVDKKDHFGPLEIPSYQGDGSGGTGGGGGGRGGSGGYGFGGIGVGPGQSGMSGFGGNVSGTGSFGGVSAGAAAAAGEAAGFGGFGGAGFGGNSWGDLGAMARTVGMNNPSLGFSPSYSLASSPSVSDYGTSLASQFSAPMATPDTEGFVASEDQEAREKKKMAMTLASPAVSRIAQAALGPLGSLGVNATMAATGLQSQEAMGKNMMGNIMGMMGGIAAGPVGAAIGYGASRALGSASPRGPGPGNQGGVDWGGVVGNLAGLYGAHKAGKELKGQHNNIQAGVDAQLANMFGPNSAYAGQLRQELSRKDAAAGRRSQYGPREVELQARLAELQARTQPGLMQSALAQQSALTQNAVARQNQKNAVMNNLLQLGSTSGVFDRIGRGIQTGVQNLGDMYGGGGWGSGNSYGNLDLGAYL